MSTVRHDLPSKKYIYIYIYVYIALGPRRRIRLTRASCGLRTSAIHNLPPQRSHLCLEKPLHSQSQTRAESQAARRRKRPGMMAQHPKSKRCVIADCGAHTAPPATTLKGEHLEHRTCQHARHLRSQRPTQETSKIVKPQAHAPCPATKLDTELGESFAQKRFPRFPRSRPRDGERSSFLTFSYVFGGEKTGSIK